MASRSWNCTTCWPRPLAIAEARTWLLDRKIIVNEVGMGLVADTRAFLESLEPRKLAEFLIGGLATTDLPDDFRSGYLALAREHTGIREYLMPPCRTPCTPGTPPAGSTAA